MADGKKSFLLYSDLIHTVVKMPDDKAGELFKHILDYVNDLNPVPKDLIIELTFEPIKQQLKRDLSKWGETRGKRSEAGKLGAEARRLKKEQNLTKLTFAKDVKQAQTKQPASVNANANASVNVSVIKNKKNIPKKIAFNFRKELLLLGVEEQYVEDYMFVRKHKKASNTKTAFTKLKNGIEKSKLDPHVIIKIMAEKSWVGFKPEWLSDQRDKLLVKKFAGSTWKEGIIKSMKE